MSINIGRVLSTNVIIIIAFGMSKHFQQIQGYGKNDCRVLLGGNIVQRLQVAQLDGTRRHGNYVRSAFECFGGSLFALGCNNLFFKKYIFFNCKILLSIM